MISLPEHALLLPGLFRTRFPDDRAGRDSPGWLADLLVDGAAGVPLRRSEELRAAVRNLLRHGGYKPTGRGKPSSEYLVRAASDGTLGPINLAVDACNAVSLHSGLPISVVDVGRAVPPLSIAVAAPQTRYVFNASGQEIDCSGLLCLFDTQGACANAVKDSQRTKTDPATRETVSVVWGHREFAGQLAGAVAWYRELLERAGAETEAP